MISVNWLQKLPSSDCDDPEYFYQVIKDIAELEPSGNLTAAKLKAILIQLIAQIDQTLSQQMSLILQHPKFQALEARWRSLFDLVTVPFHKNRVKIKFLDLDWITVSADLNLSSSIKTSQLYNKIGNKELNTLGGHPFGLMIIDHHVTAELDDIGDYDDLYTLELLGALGQHCLCPMIMSPEEKFFGESDAKWLSDINRVKKVIMGPDFDSWQKLREFDLSRFVGLTLPKIKIRDSYQNYPCGFVFNETYPENAYGSGLWGYAHYAFVATVIREFNRISWFGFLKSRWNDRLQGAVLNLPETNQGHSWFKPIPKIRLFGKLAQFYAEQGFIPLAHSPLTDKYFFMDNHSVWKGGDRTDEKVLSLIQTTLICCRIAHYLKVQIREMIGSFVSANECEQYLSKWLAKYVSNVTSGNDETLAKHPLRSAKVKVRESTASPGEYVCEVVLQPQYQFDMFAGEIFLTTDLGQGA